MRKDFEDEEMMDEMPMPKPGKGGKKMAKEDERSAIDDIINGLDGALDEEEKMPPKKGEKEDTEDEEKDVPPEDEGDKSESEDDMSEENEPVDDSEEDMPPKKKSGIVPKDMSGKEWGSPKKKC